MKRLSVQIVLGVLVLVAGALLLIQATEVATVPSLIWAGVLLAGGATFWFVFFADRPSWWAAIPGAALIGAAVTLVMELDPAGFGQWTEVPMLAVLGVGFTAVYLRDDTRWWAVIPAGILAGGAIVVLFTAVEWVTALTYVWPVAVIIGGGVLIWNAVHTHRQRIHAGAPGASADESP